MLAEITSVADLLFKAKTDVSYQRLLIRGVKDCIYTEGRPVNTVEEATAELDRYTNQCAMIFHDCSGIIRDINRCRIQIQCEEEEKEDYNKFVLKNHEGVTNQNNNAYFTSPPTNFREFNRRAEGRPTYTIEIRPGATHDAIRMTGWTSEGEPIVSERTIPNNLDMNQRREMETELHLRLREDIEMRMSARRIVRQMNNNIWSNWVGYSHNDSDPI